VESGFLKGTGLRFGVESDLRTTKGKTMRGGRKREKAQLNLPLLRKKGDNLNTRTAL